MKGSKNHPRGADAALRGAAIKKGLLQQLQSAVRGEALDRDYLRAVRLKDWDETAIHQRSIDQDGAGAAFAFSAALFRSGQGELVAQDVEQALHRVDINAFQLSIHR